MTDHDTLVHDLALLGRAIAVPGPSAGLETAVQQRVATLPTPSLDRRRPVVPAPGPALRVAVARAGRRRGRRGAGRAAGDAARAGSRGRLVRVRGRRRPARPGRRRGRAATAGGPERDDGRRSRRDGRLRPAGARGAGRARRGGRLRRPGDRVHELVHRRRGGAPRPVRRPAGLRDRQDLSRRAVRPGRGHRRAVVRAAARGGDPRRPGPAADRDGAARRAHPDLARRATSRCGWRATSASSAPSRSELPRRRTTS